jgi:hypothetical protein
MAGLPLGSNSDRGLTLNWSRLRKSASIIRRRAWSDNDGRSYWRPRLDNPRYEWTTSRTRSTTTHPFGVLPIPIGLILKFFRSHCLVTPTDISVPGCPCLRQVLLYQMLEETPDRSQPEMHTAWGRNLKCDERHRCGLSQSPAIIDTAPRIWNNARSPIDLLQRLAIAAARIGRMSSKEFSSGYPDTA